MARLIFLHLAGNLTRRSLFGFFICFFSRESLSQLSDLLEKGEK